MVPIHAMCQHMDRVMCKNELILTFKKYFKNFFTWCNKLQKVFNLMVFSLLVTPCSLRPINARASFKKNR